MFGIDFNIWFLFYQSSNDIRQSLHLNFFFFFLNLDTLTSLPTKVNINLLTYLQLFCRCLFCLALLQYLSQPPKIKRKRSKVASSTIYLEKKYLQKKTKPHHLVEEKITNPSKIFLVQRGIVMYHFSRLHPHSLCYYVRIATCIHRSSNSSPSAAM